MLLFALAATVASTVAPPPEAEAEFRKVVTQTCSQVLSQGRSWFGNEAELLASGMTVSPLFRSMVAATGVPLSAKGKYVRLIYQDRGTTRNTKVSCMIGGQPGVDVIALRDRLFETFSPTDKQRKSLRRNDFVGFALPVKGGVGPVGVVFWRDGVFVVPAEGATAR